MKKIILISLGVIILLIAGLCVYVSMIDWNKHKERLSAQISEVVGKKVEVSGNLSVSYSLRPKISAQDVKIINPQSAEVLADIPQLETNVSLLSLLKGAPDIQSLYLVDAKIWIKINENGTNNWLQQQTSEIDENNALLMQTINIENSQINFQDFKHNIKFDLSSVTAEIRAETINGPYRLDGNFMKGGEHYGTALSVDALSQLDDINVTFVVLHQGSESYVRYDGSYNVNTNAFNGFVKGDFQRTADFVNAVMGKTVLQEVYNVPMQFSVDAFSDSQKIDLTHFSIAFSQLLAGSGEIMIPKVAAENEKQPITFKYQLRDLDIRPLITQFKESMAQYYKDGTKPQIASPYDIDYDISAIRVVISDKPEGVLENVSMKGQIRADSFSIDDFYAGCAGNVVLNITGNLSMQDEVPVFATNVVADGRNFRNMINSLGFNLDAPTQSAYQSGKVTASLRITPDSLQVEELQSTLDKSNIKASATISLQDDVYDIKLNADKINFDNYIFPIGQDTPQDFKSIITADLAGLAKLNKTKVNLQADINEAVFRGVPMQKVTLDTLYADENLSIKKITIGDVLATSADISTEVGTIATAPDIKSLTFDLKSQDLLPLIKKLHLAVPEWNLFSQKNISLQGDLNGNFDKINLNLNAAAGGNSFEYNGLLEAAEKHTLADGNFVIKTTHLDQLLKDVGVTGTTYRGVLNGKAHIKGQKNDFTLSDAEFKLGKSQYSGNIDIKKKNKIRTIRGKISANEINFADFIKVQKEKSAIPAISVKSSAANSADTFISRPNLSKDAFDFASYRTLVLDLDVTAQKGVYQNVSGEKIKFKLKNDQGTISVTDISAQSGRSSVTGNMKIEYIQQPKISGSLVWKDVKIDNLGGSVYALYANGTDLSLDFDASAQSMDSILSSLSGTAKIKTPELRIKGIDLDLIKEDLQDRKYSKGLFQMVQDSLQTGISTFDPIEKEITLKEGMISLKKIALKNDHTNAMLNGDVNLKDWRINVNINVKYPHLTDMPAYEFEMTGALNKPVVDISVGDIARKYDAHWEKVTQEEQAEQAKKKKEFEERSAGINDVIEKLGVDIENSILTIDDYISQTKNEDIISQYDSQKKRFDELKNKLRMGKGKISGTKVPNEVFLDVEHRTENWRQEIDAINAEVETIRLNNIQQIIDDIQHRADEEVETCNKEVNAAKDKINQSSNRLKEIGEQEYLTEDKDFQLTRKKMELDAGVVGDIRATLAKRAEKIEQMTDYEDKLTEVSSLKSNLEQLEQQCIMVKNECNEAVAAADAIVKKREDIYKRKLLEAEKKRREEAAEDEGNLLAEDRYKEETATTSPLLRPVTEDTGTKATDNAHQSDVATPSSGDLQQAPQPNSASTKPILIPAEASSQPQAASGRIIRSYDAVSPVVENKKTSSGILKPAEGIVIKPSGTITTK